MNRSFFMIAGVCAVVSIVVAAFVVRLCLIPGYKMPLSPASIVCGISGSSEKSSFKLLLPNDAVVTSNVPERIDASNPDREAKNLMDGRKETLASPGMSELDYTVSFFNSYEIKQIVIHWGDYGVNQNYIASWKLQTSLDGSPWKDIGEGSSPRDFETVIHEKFASSAIRIIARSAVDWIGVYEIEVIGRPL